MNQARKTLARNRTMKSSTILMILLLQALLIGCTVTMPAPSRKVDPATATPCPTKPAENQTVPGKQSGESTMQSSSGNTSAGQTGKIGPGAGVETPSPEQIATSQAMLDQSNRSGPA